MIQEKSRDVQEFLREVPDENHAEQRHTGGRVQFCRGKLFRKPGPQRNSKLTRASVSLINWCTALHPGGNKVLSCEASDGSLMQSTANKSPSCVRRIATQLQPGR